GDDPASGRRRRGVSARGPRRKASPVTWRDLMCGEPRAADIGKRLTLSGWAARRRDHGGLIFIDLRDHTGLCQLVVNPEHAAEAAEQAHRVRAEFVLRGEGELVAPAPDAA